MNVVTDYEKAGFIRTFLGVDIPYIQNSSNDRTLQNQVQNANKYQSERERERERAKRGIILELILHT